MIIPVRDCFLLQFSQKTSNVVSANSYRENDPDDNRKISCGIGFIDYGI
jgi:hypothetical protein